MSSLGDVLGIVMLQIKIYEKNYVLYKVCVVSGDRQGFCFLFFNHVTTFLHFYVQTEE